MREDMEKVVTERPRAGMRYKAPKGLKKQYEKEIRNECESHREKIRQKWQSGYEGKQFTDVLGPIYGYILKQVGRRWDDVYSEICKNLPNNSLNTSHVRGHIKDFVEIQVMMIDGVPYDTKGVSRVSNYGRWPFAFYVHPETNILCKLKQEQSRRWNRRRKVGIDVPGEPLQQYHCIDDVWYVLTLKPRKEPTDDRYWRYREVYDVGYKRSLSINECRDLFGGDFISVGKKQLNGKEVKKAGLNKRKAA
jgi:hypothetical protein